MRLNWAQKCQVIGNSLASLFAQGIVQPTASDVVNRAHERSTHKVISSSDVNNYFATDPTGRQLVRDGRCMWHRRGMAPNWAGDHPEYQGGGMGALPTVKPPVVQPLQLPHPNFPPSVSRDVKLAIQLMIDKLNKSGREMEEYGITPSEKCRRQADWQDEFSLLQEFYLRLVGRHYEPVAMLAKQR